MKRAIAEEGLDMLKPLPDLFSGRTFGVMVIDYALIAFGNTIKAEVGLSNRGVIAPEVEERSS